LLSARSVRHHLSSTCSSCSRPVVCRICVPPSFPTRRSSDLRFIQKQHYKTDYTASHCAGAFLLGEAGIADGKQIVTYCGGSESLDRKSTRLNSSHVKSSYAVFC